MHGLLALFHWRLKTAV